MFNIIEYKDIANEENIIYIDVRSEAEFEEDTIEGAINIPVLTNDERVEVGTIYVQESVEKAKSVGISHISKRLPMIFDKIQELYINNRDKKIVLFCSRGGMRSGSIHSLLMSLGLKVYKLKRGYKDYRQYINENLPILLKDINFIVLHGNTGCGKTKILNNLESIGYDVMDIEKAANHRGSLLGNVYLGKQHSQKYFESYIYNKIKKRKTNNFFIEGESKRIGNIIIPMDMWYKMSQGTQILIESNLDFRAEILLDDYKESSEKNKEELIDAIDTLKKHINSQRVEEYKDMIRDNMHKEVAIDLMERYYDPLYSNSLKNKEFFKTIFITDINKAVEDIKNIYITVCEKMEE